MFLSIFRLGKVKYKQSGLLFMKQNETAFY